MSGIVDSLEKVIYKTTTELIDSNLTTKIAVVAGTFINAGFEVADDVLKKLQDMTKPEA